MKTAILLAISAATFLQGCATSPETQAKMDIYNRTIPICESEGDCRVKWEAAQIWVARNAAYRIQTSTDVLIETFGPLDYNTGLAMRVLREPLGNARYRITISAYCANLFGCTPNQHDAVIDFNRVVAAAMP